MTGLDVTGKGGRWTARTGGHTGGATVGALRSLVLPDGRCFVRFDDCRDDAYGPLLSAAAAELDRDLYATAPDDDEAQLRRLTALGFAVHRREQIFRIATDPAAHGLTGDTAAPGVDLVSAADVDLDRLRELDEVLREDIPGSAGWRWDPQAFRDETFGPDFDPATYLVAVERSTGDYVGLLRVWLNPGGPRLGCLAVLPAFRRTRVTRALVAAVAAVLHERGHREVVTEIAVDNRASMALLARRPVVRAGGTYELVLRRRASAGAGPGALEAGLVDGGGRVVGG